MTNSVASTRPKRSTTVSQTIDESIQCLAAPSGKSARVERGLVGQRRRGAGGVTRRALRTLAFDPLPHRARTIGSAGPRLSRNMTRLSSARHLQVIFALGSATRIPMRILVIEDEPSILAFLSRGLEAEGFVGRRRRRRPGRARAARCAERLRPGRPRPAAAKARRARRAARAPAATAGAAGGDRLGARRTSPTKLRGFGLGACDYVSKPFSLDELLARVRAQLRARPLGRATGTSSRPATLTLDLARRQARLGEVVADLSDREFRLLHHLVRHQGEVVSRERLLSEVWGYHFDPALERRRRLRAAAAEEARRRRRRSRRCGMAVTGLLRRRRRRARVARLRGGEPRRDGARPELGDDPVPLHLDQPDPGLRLPGLGAGRRPASCSAS